MGDYRHIETGEVKTQGAWRSHYKNVSLPRSWTAATLDGLKLEPVFETPKPDAGQYQNAVRNGVEKDVKGNWVWAWAIRDMFSDYTDEAGVLHTKAAQEAAYQAKLDADTKIANDKAINAERDRRLAADFTFNGKQFQRDATSLARITGAATLAGFAVAQGSPAGNLRWANPARDFEWIASDDTRVPMDAQTAFDFGAAAARVETTLVFAGSALRAMSPIPADFTDDKWWT